MTWWCNTTACSIFVAWERAFFLIISFTVWNIFIYMQKRNEFQQSWKQKKRNNLASPRCTQWCSNRKFHIRSITMFQTQNMRFSSRWFLYCGCYFRVVFAVAHFLNFISDLKAIKQICSGKTIAYVLECQERKKKTRPVHTFLPPAMVTTWLLLYDDGKH